MRDLGAAGDRKSPRPGCRLAGVVHSDSGPAEHACGRHGLTCRQPHRSDEQVGPVLAPIDRQSLTKSPWTAGKGPLSSRQRNAAAARSKWCPVDNLDRAQQHGVRHSLVPADDVGAVVHTVDQVDVEVPGRPEHDSVARRRPPEGMARRVVESTVGLDLDDPRDDEAVGVLANQPPAEQIGSDLERIASAERPRQGCRLIHPRPIVRSAPQRRDAPAHDARGP